jgi:hypothetical protein
VGSGPDRGRADVEEDIVGRSLLEILREVAVNPAEQAALADMGAAPYLARHGFHEVDVQDVREAVDLVADTLPPEVAQALAFARTGPAHAPGQPEALELAVLRDGSEQLDSIPPRSSGDGDGGSAPASDIIDEARRTSDAVGGPEASLTFGAGADAADTDERGDDDVVGKRPETIADGEVAATGDQGALDGSTVATENALDMPPDVDAAVGVEPTTTWAGGTDENALHDLPEDASVLDDIGSF